MIHALIAFATAHLAVLFYLAGLLGMLAHYVKKWSRGEYKGNLWAYLVADNPRATLSTVITYAAAATAVVATGSIAGMSLAQVFAAGFTTGFAIDSAVNKT